MGLMGFLVTVLLLILGAGYFLFGTESGSVTVENAAVGKESTADMMTGSGEIARYQAIKNQAQGVKDMVEKRSAETMKQGAGSNEQEGLKTAVSSPADGMTVPNISIIEKKIDFGFGIPKEKRNIDTIVLHSSYNPDGNPYSVDKVIAIWKDYGVSPHYLIDRQGNIYRLVDDADIAYHAGVSKMPDGRTNVNDFSIGIEMLNTKDGTYTDAEYASVNALIAYLRGKYSIKQVVGHADIAPGRKDDPWKFDWKRVK